MKRNIFYIKFIAVSVLMLILNFDIVKSQYFGRNKPGYEVFDFNVYQTPNFEIYHYFNDSNTVQQLAKTSEQWYKMHHEVFLDSIKSKNPLIFYQDHADFQQTNTSFSSIGIGTGGFTEALKNRVVMPVSLTKSQTDHVLGHELVHAFQYNIFAKDSAMSFKNMQNIPLWMVEGMAEYLSIGSVSPQTSMWMRDAILNDEFPTLEEMTKNMGKYNPYRYGHAFWAFATKMWGDSIIKPIFVLTAKRGYSAALDSVVGFNGESVSSMWKMATLTHYKNVMGDTSNNVVGKKLLFEGNAGEMNISPVISPDGKYVAFLSEKDLFTIDLFLADASNGEIKSKLSSTVHNSEIDAFNFIESAGTWSPDGKQFAHIIFSKGRNKLAIVDVKKSKIVDEVDMGEIQSFNNPSWSPDGEKIAFTGMIEGQGNLFTYHVKTGKIEKITNDSFSNIQPSWSPDSKTIAYVTDRKQPSQTGDNLKFNIATLNLETNEINVLNAFPGADNYNPLFSSDGNSIFFLSDRDGFRNLYRYNLVTDKVYQQTKFLTGISGITMQSPAISISNDDNIVYSYYFDQKYTVYKANIKDFYEVEVDKDELEFAASTLPPLKHFSENIVDNHLQYRPNINSDITNKFKEVPYRPKFKLDYISNSGFGFGTSRFGTSMAGSVSAIFSDIIGDNQIFASLALNGEIYDFGGQVAYFNQKQRINWGGAISHIPYRYGYYTLTKDTLDIDDESYVVDNYALDIIRLFETKATAFAFYPISTTRRIEAGMGYAMYNYRIDRYNNYFDALGYGIGGSREKQPAPDGFNLFQTDLAYVFDNSYFAITSPMQGRRSRVSVEKNFGYYNHISTLIDYRKYFFVKPVSFAFRFYNYSRWGHDAEKDRMNPLYVGYPWLVRGYNNVSYQGQEEVLDTTGLSLNHLMGSKMQIVNFEFRIPFTGPKKLSLIPSKFLFTDLAFFVDGGLAWTNNDKPKLKWERTNFTNRVPVFSAGASVRINLFGYMIIEPYYAFPFQGNPQNKGVFGVNFTPGW